METLFSWLDQTINKNPVAALTVLVAISIFLFGYLLVRLQEQIRSLGDYVDDRESAQNQKYRSLRDLSAVVLDKHIELSSRIEDPAFKGDLAIARELVTLVNKFMETCNTHFCRLDNHVKSLEESLGNRLDEVESALETVEDTLKYGTASDTDAVKDELLDCIQAKEETAPAVSNKEGFSRSGKPLNSDKIPEGYRKLGDSVAEPRRLGDLRWSVAQKRYVEITFEEIGYANRDNWAACRIISGEVTPEVTVEVAGEVAGEVTGEATGEVTGEVTREAETEWVDAVWPEDLGKPARFWPNPIYPGEGAPDYALWDLGTLAGYVGYVADVYRPWIMEVNGKISCQMYCQVKKKVGTKEQPTELHGGLRPDDNVALAMRMAANSFGGNDGVFNGAGFANAMRQLAGVTCNLDGYVVATILDGRSDVEVLKGGSHYRYLFYESINSSQEQAEPPKPTVEVTVEVTGEVKHPLGCPDGWRFLEVGEVIRKGDVWLEDGQIHSLGLLMIGQTCQTHWKPIIRRNRFEVGEKVVGGLDGFEFVVVGKHSRFSDVYVVRNKITGTIHNILDRLLAPYIEEIKPTGEVTGEVKPEWMPAVGERVRFKGQPADRPDWIVNYLLDYSYVLLKRSTDGVPSGGYVSQLEPTPKPEQETEAPKPRFSRGELVRIVLPKGLLPGETFIDPISKSTFYAHNYEAYLGKDGQIVGPSTTKTGLWEVVVFMRDHRQMIRLPEVMLHKVLS